MNWKRLRERTTDAIRSFATSIEVERIAPKPDLRAEVRSVGNWERRARRQVP